jgi:hypothetical protein
VNRDIGFANPPKNQRWRIGHVQRQVKRSFVASGGQPLTTGDLIRRAYPRQTKFESWQYAQVRQSAERWAVRMGTASQRGEPVLWKPKAVAEATRGDTAPEIPANTIQKR